MYFSDDIVVSCTAELRLRILIAVLRKTKPLRGDRVMLVGTSDSGGSGAALRALADGEGSFPTAPCRSRRIEGERISVIFVRTNVRGGGLAGKSFRKSPD